MPKVKPVKEEVFHISEFEWMEGNLLWLEEDVLQRHVQPHRPRPPPKFPIQMPGMSLEERESIIAANRYRSARTKKSGELIRARKALPLHQRLWLKALETNSYVENIAHGSLQRAGFMFSLDRCRAWKNGVRFKAALELSMSLAADEITKDRVILNTQHVYDMAMTPQPILHKGRDTGFKEVELNAAAKVLEMQHKRMQMFGDEGRSRVTLEIELIDFASNPVPSTIDNDTGEVIEGG